MRPRCTTSSQGLRPDDAPISGRDGEALLESAIEAVLDLEDVKAREASGVAEEFLLADRDERRDELMDNLPGIPEDAYLSDVDYTAGQLMEIIEWLALQDRQMYQALHELEALQKRRGGEATPLARVDVQT
jgi:hypothetical protein